MTETLYRKYRPKTFADVVGQNHVKITLQSELTSEKVAHSYLFTGPRGVGKTTVARIMAKAVNCLHRGKDGDPDAACEACQDFQSGRSLDLIEIDAASHTGVDNVRSYIIENARFSPSRWKYKVFIIDEVHMLSISAFNALLKTLEEPPEHAIFILATTEIHKVPETIISRCQRFDFRRLRQEDIVGRLRSIVQQEKLAVDDAVLEEIARSARGSSRDAESLLGQVLTLAEDGKVSEEQAALVLPRTDMDFVVQLFDALVRKDASAGITVVNNLVREGVHVQRFTQNALEFFRKALLLKLNSQLVLFSSLELSKEHEQRLLQQIENVDIGYLERMIRVLYAHNEEPNVTNLPQLPLEMAIIELTVGLGDAVSLYEDPVAPTAPKPKPNAAPPAPIGEQLAGVASKVKKTRSNDQPPLTLESVQNHWPEVLGSLQSRNQSLRLTLNVAAPHEVRDNTVVLAVAYDFHRERIEMPKNRSMIEEVFEEVLHQPVSISVALDPNFTRVPSYEAEANVEVVAAVAPAEGENAASADDPNAEAAWNALVETFGGK